MKELTGESFAEMLTLCSQHSNFKVGIVFDKKQVMEEFITDIKEIGEIPGVSRMRQSSGYALLEFYNGSSVEIIPSRTDLIRGRKYNQVLFHFAREMTEDARNELRATTISYVTDETKTATDAVLFAAKFGMMNEVSKIKDELKQMEDDTSSEELDSFLDEFKVSDNRCAPTCES